MYKILYIFLAAASLVLFFICGQNFFTEQKKEESPRPQILVSVSPYVYFVERISQNTLVAQSAVAGITNPHLFEPTPKQVAEFSKVDIWLRIGELFEKKISEALQQQNPSLVMVDMCEGIHLLSTTGCKEHAHEHSHAKNEGRDRHIWLSPTLAKMQAEKIAKVLILRYPNQKSIFEEGLKKFLVDLEELDKEIKTLLTPYRGEGILTSHPAFAYFCQDYGLTQLAVESEGKDPLPQYIEQIMTAARQMRVRSILTQPQYNNKGAELFAEKLRLPIYLVDPYAKNYIENLKHLSHLIATP